MESIVYKTTELIDGRVSVTYLIRNNADVQSASVILPKDTNIIEYGEINKSELFANGSIPNSKVAPLALFQATKNKSAESIHMGAIFAAFQQLQMGGSLSDMKVSAKQVYSQDDQQLQSLLSFIQTFKAANQDDKDELMAIAIYAASSLVTL